MRKGKDGRLSPTQLGYWLIYTFTRVYSTRQSDRNSFCGDAVLDSNYAIFRNEDSILDQIYKTKLHMFEFVLCRFEFQQASSAIAKLFRSKCIKLYEAIRSGQFFYLPEQIKNHQYITTLQPSSAAVISFKKHVERIGWCYYSLDMNIG